MPDKLSIGEFSFKSMVLIKSWSDSVEITDTLLAKYLGVKLIPKVGQFISQDDVYCAVLSPGHIMLFSTHESRFSDVSKILSPETAAIINVSHSRRGIRLQGEKSTSLLNKDIAIDLSDDAFPELRVLQSSIHSIGIILFKLKSDDYLIFSYSSFFESFYAWVIDSAEEYGYALT
jgi:heterotetrameric sarcosine oxidase gamma subunit